MYTINSWSFSTVEHTCIVSSLVLVQHCEEDSQIRVQQWWISQISISTGNSFSFFSNDKHAEYGSLTFFSFLNHVISEEKKKCRLKDDESATSYIVFGRWLGVTAVEIFLKKSFLFQLRTCIHLSFSFCLNVFFFFLMISGFSGRLASQHATVTLPLALKAEESSKNKWEKPEAVSSA